MAVEPSIRPNRPNPKNKNSLFRLNQSPPAKLGMADLCPSNGHKTGHSRVPVVNGSYFTSGVKEKVEILILPLPVPPRPILGASWGIGDGARLRSRFWVR